MSVTVHDSPSTFSCAWALPVRTLPRPVRLGPAEGSWRSAVVTSAVAESCVQREALCPLLIFLGAGPGSELALRKGRGFGTWLCSAVWPR